MLPASAAWLTPAHLQQREKWSTTCLRDFKHPKVRESGEFIYSVSFERLWSNCRHVLLGTCQEQVVRSHEFNSVIPRRKIEVSDNWKKSLDSKYQIFSSEMQIVEIQALILPKTKFLRYLKSNFNLISNYNNSPTLESWINNFIHQKFADFHKHFHSQYPRPSIKMVKNYTQWMGNSQISSNI